MDKISIINEAKKHNLKVEWSDWVISARVENTLFINPNLPKYDGFCRETLEHEYKHTGKFTSRDLFIDMVDGSIIDTLKFCFNHPKAFARFFPVSIYNNEFHIDINTIIIYIIIFCLIMGLFNL